ncbi:flavin reductase family protein [Aliidiomarina celeris]|uniref:flavin reductase family protein n=1 Tax=Aliidiomarina celeris TaxID=2249428 RepID=UPI000DEB84F6|nr:flavin reductase family protein [Aliidiomarina celeris]
MIIDFSQLSANERYHTVTQTLVPRPIAWVLSQHENGHYNVAPFSYFTAISSDPALLMFSVGDKDNGVGKDTKVNIAEHPYFVVHIASSKHAEAVTASAKTLPAEASELELFAHELEEFEGFSLPKLKGVAVAYGCKLHSLQQVEGAPQTLVFGEIERVYISDHCAVRTPVEGANGEQKQRLNVDSKQLDPLARLGGANYATLGSVINVKRPK